MHRGCENADISTCGAIPMTKGGNLTLYNLNLAQIVTKFSWLRQRDKPKFFTFSKIRPRVFLGKIKVFCCWQNVFSSEIRMRQICKFLSGCRNSWNKS